MMRRVILFLALLSFAYAQDSKFGGIYLPDVYLSELSKSKSHVVATKKFYEQTDAEERALVITPDGITYIYGNEAEGRDIIKIDKNKITVEKKSYDDENTSLDIYITAEGKIKNANGVKYSRISSETDGATNIMMHFITEAIFTDKHYKNKAGDELYRFEDGQISYKSTEYQFSLGADSESVYDIIYTHKGCLFTKVTNGKVYVYKGVVEEGEPEHFATEFFLEDELE